MMTKEKVADIKKAAEIAKGTTAFKEHKSVRLFAVGDNEWKEFHELTEADCKTLAAIYYYPDGALDYANDYMRKRVKDDVEMRIESEAEDTEDRRERAAAENFDDVRSMDHDHSME